MLVAWLSSHHMAQVNSFTVTKHPVVELLWEHALIAFQGVNPCIEIKVKTIIIIELQT